MDYRAVIDGKLDVLEMLRRTPQSHVRRMQSALRANVGRLMYRLPAGKHTSSNSTSPATNDECDMRGEGGDALQQILRNASRHAAAQSTND
jgi:hypothetical protein